MQLISLKKKRHLPIKFHAAKRKLSSHYISLIQKIYLFSQLNMYMYLPLVFQRFSDALFSDSAAVCLFQIPWPSQNPLHDTEFCAQGMQPCILRSSQHIFLSLALTCNYISVHVHVVCSIYTHAQV